MSRFLCLAGQAVGQDFLRQVAELGIQPVLLTLDSLCEADWPREALEDLATMPAGLSREQILNTVAWMARGRQFNRIVALDEENLLTAAELREHLRIPGMGITTAGYYRDRLAMLISARESGFAIPEFCRVLNYGDLREFMLRVPPPWFLKPRTRLTSERVQKIESEDALWRELDQLGDRQSHFLLEEALAGEHFSVESIVSEGRVVFSAVFNHCEIDLGGGRAQMCETVDRTSRVWMELTALNAGITPSLGMVRGVAQAQFFRKEPAGKFFFHEIAAGVGKPEMDRLVEAASGLNLWREWARLEAEHLEGGSYHPGEWLEAYAAQISWPAGQVHLAAPEKMALEVIEDFVQDGEERLFLRSTQREKVSSCIAALCARRAEREPVYGSPREDH